ncbi:geranylgeranylglycerol-phosphate geranylgeranyltransferase [Flavobacterium agricola]|uniref:Geranylgeranylglycerol-phosphate geranylgeranyltransferase n=1 Tax=Flavobacterium agricola TaxID=2870839 RepID=A0ABY6M184_9FLAO|nr:geranylgeranylglycerol-phosphate geranylgeranyltransferase [Flavobacterium agricola]UYW02191.1 geranylgeranylglycerol-phosphate geranylgeranyltransferase [Flavobacterium agricola]
MKYLNLIRYKNLAIVALMQAVFHFVFIKNQTDYVALSNLQFVVLILATLCIAAGGYIINDIEDQQTDAINKPYKKYVGTSISENIAFYLYVSFTIVGVALGYYLANLIGKNSFVGFFIITSMLLYLYATWLKGIPVIGNLLVAFLLALSVLIIGFFDILPATYSGNYQQQRYLFSVIIDFAVFAFIINFIREVLKDIEDVNGDYNAGIKTLPVILGISRTAKILAFVTGLAILILLYYVLLNFSAVPLVLAYALLFLLAPFIYFFIKLNQAKKTSDFSTLSRVLKLIMLFGILALVVIQLNFHFNAQ